MYHTTIPPSCLNNHLPLVLPSTPPPSDKELLKVRDPKPMINKHEIPDHVSNPRWNSTKWEGLVSRGKWRGCVEGEMCAEQYELLGIRMERVLHINRQIRGGEQEGNGIERMLEYIPGFLFASKVNQGNLHALPFLTFPCPFPSPFHPLNPLYL